MRESALLVLSQYFPIKVKQCLIEDLLDLYFVVTSGYHDFKFKVVNVNFLTDLESFLGVGIGLEPNKTAKSIMPICDFSSPYPNLEFKSMCRTFLRVKISKH